MLTNKKMLVTGGAGFLGSHVSRMLLEQENRVAVLDDFSNGKMAHLADIERNSGLTIHRGSVTNLDDIRKACDGCQVIIHLAVLGLRQSIRQRQLVNDVILNGTLACLDVALEQEIELFVNCSSSEAYGTAEYMPMDEAHPLRPRTPYAAAKVAQDMFVQSFGHTYGLPWITVRPFNMYGPHSHWQGIRGELIPRMIVRAMNGKPLVIFGDGKQSRDFLYVTDAARAFLDVIDRPECRGETLNICTEIKTSIRLVAELICENYGIDPAEGIENHASRPGDVECHIGDYGKAQKLANFEPTITIEEGIKLTIEWIRSLPYTAEELFSHELLRNWE